MAVSALTLRLGAMCFVLPKSLHATATETVPAFRTALMLELESDTMDVTLPALWIARPTALLLAGRCCALLLFA
jgi:hypothetical protein